MMIPVDVRVAVYAGVVLGFSRRLLRRVLRPARSASVDFMSMRHEVTLCLECGGHRFYMGGPWRVMFDTQVEMCRAVSRWNRKMPPGVGMSLPGGDYSDRMNFTGFAKENGWEPGDSSIGTVFTTVNGCLAELDDILWINRGRDG